MSSIRPWSRDHYVSGKSLRIMLEPFRFRWSRGNRSKVTVTSHKHIFGQEQRETRINPVPFAFSVKICSSFGWKHVYISSQESCHIRKYRWYRKWHILNCGWADDSVHSPEISCTKSYRFICWLEKKGRERCVNYQPKPPPPPPPPGPGFNRAPCVGPACQANPGSGCKSWLVTLDCTFISGQSP